MNGTQKPENIQKPASPAQTSHANSGMEPAKGGAPSSAPSSTQGRAKIRPGAMMGRGGPGALMPGEKSKDFKGTMKKLIAYLGP